MWMDERVPQADPAQSESDPKTVKSNPKLLLSCLPANSAFWSESYCGTHLFFCPPLSVLTMTRHPLIHPIHGGGYSPASPLDQAIVESIPILFELNLGGGFKMGIDCYYNILKVYGTSCRITEAVPPRTLLSSAFCPGVSLGGYFT